MASIDHEDALPANAEQISNVDLARLNRISKDPLARPSERVAARLALKPLRGPERLAGSDREAALAVARKLLAEMQGR